MRRRKEEKASKRFRFLKKQWCFLASCVEEWNANLKVRFYQTSWYKDWKAKYSYHDFTNLEEFFETCVASANQSKSGREKTIFPVLKVALYRRNINRHQKSRHQRWRHHQKTIIWLIGGRKVAMLHVQPQRHKSMMWLLECGRIIVPHVRHAL